ncbi:restriction endonuclease [Candidatus Bathyarchaeota archaeon]|nr:restriction endonuclease [Candidatus Bathyarchaeota archaeon]
MEENIVVIIGRTIIIKMIENKQTSDLLNIQDVNKFVSIKNLCNDDVRLLIRRLMEKEAYLIAPSWIKELIQNKDKLAQLEPVLKWFGHVMGNIMNSEFAKTLEKQIIEENKIDEELLKREDLRSDLLFRVKGKINKKQLVKYEKELLSIDKEIQDKTGYRALEPSTIFICPHCRVIITEQEIESKKCLSCSKEILDAERIPIYKVNENIKKIWFNNLWFEAYLGKLLRKLGWKTWVDVYVMGASGVSHQIDVLGIHQGKGIVLAVECKTGKFSRNDVFNFCTKIADIKAHMAILALLEELPDQATREFVKKNPAIIRLENMRNLNEDDILSDLKMRFDIKT